MSVECQSIDPLVTPFVDGELAASERYLVEEHLRRCPPCHSRVAAERAVHELMQARRIGLCADCAPRSLRQRCAAHRAVRPFHPAGAVLWRERAGVLAAAATLVLVVSGAFLYQATEHSPQLLAAELTSDHLKCFLMNRLLGTEEAPEQVQQSMLSGFGWRMQLPEQAEQSGLTLVGARPCLYAEGKIAHLMFRHQGRPVSVFMLPRAVRPQELLDVMGHHAAVWSVGSRTFVLVASEPRADVEQMASIFQASLR